MKKKRPVHPRRRPSAPRTGDDPAIMAALVPGPLSGRALAKTLRRRVAAIAAACNRLERAGRLRREGQRWVLVPGAQCKSRNRTGQRCRREALIDSPFCNVHADEPRWLHGPWTISQARAVVEAGRSVRAWDWGKFQRVRRDEAYRFLAFHDVDALDRFERSGQWEAGRQRSRRTRPQAPVAKPAPATAPAAVTLTLPAIAPAEPPSTGAPATTPPSPVTPVAMETAAPRTPSRPVIERAPVEPEPEVYFHGRRLTHRDVIEALGEDLAHEYLTGKIRKAKAYGIARNRLREMASLSSSTIYHSPFRRGF